MTERKVADWIAAACEEGGEPAMMDALLSKAKR